MRVAQVLNLRKKVSVRCVNERSYFIPFQDLSPIELIDRNDTQKSINDARPCVGQMTVLLQCLKDADYNQKRCTEPLKLFYACIGEHEAAKSRQAVKLSDKRRASELTKLEATQLLKSKPIK